jgi:hypothetical protein
MRSIILLTLAIAIGGCSRQEYGNSDTGPTIAGGIITDAVTGKILNSDINLAEIWQNDPRHGLKIINSCHPGDDGNFHFEFISREGAEYYITPDNPAYFPIPENGPLYCGMPNNNLRIAFLPKGYVRYIIRKDKTRTGNLDFIQLPYTGQSIHCDTTFTGYVKGGLENDLNYTLKYMEEPVARTRNFIINVQPGDTVNYIIEY